MISDMAADTEVLADTGAGARPWETGDGGSGKGPLLSEILVGLFDFSICGRERL